jgi:maltokinase
MAPEIAALFELAPRYLDRQEWLAQTVANDAPAAIELISGEILREGPPGLARLVLGRGERRLQLLVGWRHATELAGVLRNEDRALLGSVPDGDLTLIVYDALADDELARVILGIATDGREQAHLVRPLATLVSHASLVFDEHLFMKCYRVLEHGPRPEVEVLFRLDEVGFNALLAPIGRWREGEFDLALVREFLPSALEGRLLALTSLRDLLAHAARGEEAAGNFQALPQVEDADLAAASAGGDFSSEMVRLGETTAHLHLALAEAFGTGELGDGEGGLDVPGAALGPAIQLHGDYHLRRVMRSETGWLVTGFGDDPLYATEVVRPSLELRSGSCLEDVADMMFALGRVTSEALAQRPDQEASLAAALAAAWLRRNRGAFLRGYLRTQGIEALLPGDAELRDRLLAGYEAVRERRYEATSSGV